MSSQDKLVEIAEIRAAEKRLDGIANHTPVLTSTNVNQITNSQVFFKCENFQRTGSFKFRGAYVKSPGSKIGVIISGGNVDLRKMGKLFDLMT